MSEFFIPSTDTGGFIPSPAAGTVGAAPTPRVAYYGGTDPDAAIAAVLRTAERVIARHVDEAVKIAVWEYRAAMRRALGDRDVDLPPLPATSVASAVRSGIEAATAEIGVTGRALRGQRIVHRAAVHELEQILRDVASDPVLQRHPGAQRIAAKLIREYLRHQEGRDEFAVRRVAAAGGNPDPAPYRAPATEES